MADAEFTDEEMSILNDKLNEFDFTERERGYLQTAVRAARTESQLISLREQLGKSYSSYSSSDDSGLTIEVQARIKPSPPIK